MKRYIVAAAVLGLAGATNVFANDIECGSMANGARFCAQFNYNSTYDPSQSYPALSGAQSSFTAHMEIKKLKKEDSFLVAFMKKYSKESVKEAQAVPSNYVNAIWHADRSGTRMTPTNGRGALNDTAKQNIQASCAARTEAALATAYSANGNYACPYGSWANGSAYEVAESCAAFGNDTTKNVAFTLTRFVAVCEPACINFSDLVVPSDGDLCVKQYN